MRIWQLVYLVMRKKEKRLSVKDGVYTLTYDDNVIDSFVMFIGNVDAELAFRY